MRRWQRRQARVETWRFGVFEVDTRQGGVAPQRHPHQVREQSFLILVYLLEHAGEIVTREELRQVLWPSDTFVDFDHSMNTAMMKLRDALGDSTETPLYIETIPKRGYRFIAPVSSIGLCGQPSMVPSKTSASPSDEAQLMPPLSNPALDQRRRRLRHAGVLGLLLLVVTTALWLFGMNDSIFERLETTGHTLITGSSR